MNKAVQAPVQGRDGAVQAHATSLKPWTPRRDGLGAILVSERATVFDRPSPSIVPPADPASTISDPIWNDKGGTSWTPDLVHARFLLTGETVRRLPGPQRKRYACTLGQIALTEMAATRRIPPTPEEITLADWTLEQIMQRAHRQVLLAASFGFSGDKIAEALQAKGLTMSGTTVQRLYLAERRILAGQWQASRVPVARLDVDRRELAFPKGPK